jgi:hypothetical protein
LIYCNYRIFFNTDLVKDNYFYAGYFLGIFFNLINCIVCIFRYNWYVYLNTYMCIDYGDPYVVILYTYFIIIISQDITHPKTAPDIWERKTIPKWRNIYRIINWYLFTVLFLVLLKQVQFLSQVRFHFVLTVP